ncbi:MAG TPA: MFS transporter [Thermoleophilaceae bacterium]
MGGVSLYGALFRTPRIAGLLSAMVVARMPIGINSLALVLFFRHEGKSFGVAGAAAGALALGSALGAPLAARLIDRFGPRVLLGLAAVHAGGLVVVIALTLHGAPNPVLVPAAFLVGSSLPPISSVLRAAYRTVLAHDPELIPTAFAFEAVLTEVIFVVGPLAVAVLVWVASAAAALIVSAVCCVVGTAWFLSALPGSIRRYRAPHAPGREIAGALRSAGLRTLVMAMLPVGFAFGALEVTLPAFADAQGHRQLAGVLLAILSIGSMAGGIFYGARPRRFPLLTVHLLCAVSLPVVIALLATAGSAAQMGLLLLLAGLPIAPLIATRNELAGLVALPGSETEAFTWPLTALVSGVAIGAAVAGALADGPGWRSAILVATIVAALGALVSLAFRDTLRPAAAAT